jgi:hypothetical protein
MKFVCVYSDNAIYPGDTLEEAWLECSRDQGCELDEVSFYDLGKELHVELKLVEVEKLVVGKAKGK